MKTKTPLDMKNLRQVFTLTAIVTVIVCLTVSPLSLPWSLNYGIVSGLALANWFALSKLLSGVVGKKLEDLLVGIFLKPLLLVFLLIYAKHLGIEITSFLAGLNTFFVCLFVFIGWRLLRSLVDPGKNHPSSITTSESGAHG